MKLQLNEGPADRLVRLLLGFALLTVAAVATGPLVYVALVAGLIGLVTGATGFCPTYALLGKSTLPRGVRSLGPADGE